MTVLDQVLTEHFARHRDAALVADTRGVLTGAELAGAAGRFAAEAAAWWNGTGATRRDGRVRVLVSAANSAAYVAAYAGILDAGAVPFLIDPALGGDEFSSVVESCGIDVVLHDRDLPATARPGARTELGGFRLTEVAGGPRPQLLAGTEVCRFTSGTSGTPNCIEFSGTAVRNAAVAWKEATALEPADRVLCFAGLFNGLAYNTSLLASILAGACLWLPSGLPSAGHVTRFLRELAPTRLVGFPALYEALLRKEGEVPELAGVRVALSSAAPLSEQTAQDLLRRHGLAVSNYYGIAEAGPLTFDPAPTPEGGLGLPLPGVRFRLDDGEIKVRSESMGSRYLNVPGAFERKVGADGFYATADEGFFDDQGSLHLRGRVGKALNIAGRKLDGEEIRRVVLDAGCADAVVFADRKNNGDPVLVAVVAGAGAPDERALRSWCHARLAAHKVPERFVRVEAIPRTSLGKLRMAAVQELFHEAIATSPAR
ncbi:class I adenylate-forming enzyme family protein [Amycolatopsis sp. NPDC005232]|uniref:class I adenylate-forming enzyme family protein n=1 Tax=Amycolatopsis sp. NPDC005232 TaxID=3157027 RepID=UPI0033BCFC4F